MSDLFERMRKGAWYGILFACFYAAYAVILYVVRGAEPFSKDGTTLSAVLAAYFAGGTLAGGIVGALQPLTRTRLGAMVVYSTAAFFVFVSIAVAADGPHHIWWLGCVLIGAAFGIFGAFAWRNLLG